MKLCGCVVQELGGVGNGKCGLMNFFAFYTFMKFQKNKTM